MPFRRAQEYTVDAKALTDPRPAFVSLVRAGANQVPFRSVKAAAPEETEMNERIEAMRANGHEVAEVTFTRGETFPDIEAVTAWLTAGGYPTEGVVETEKAFTLSNTGDQFVEGSIVQVKTDDDTVTVYVGKLIEAAPEAAKSAEEAPRGKVTAVEIVDKKSDEPVEDETRTGKDTQECTKTGDELPDEDAIKATEEAADGDVIATGEATKTEGEEPVARAVPEEDAQVIAVVEEAMASRVTRYASDEMRRRFDDFMAHFSESMTLGGVIADANDGIPAGFGEAVMAMVAAIRNNILSGNPEGVRSVAGEFGDLVVALAVAFTGNEDESAERCQKMIDTFKESLPAQTGGEQPAAEGGVNDAVLRAISELATKVETVMVKTEASITEVKQKVDEVTSTVSKSAADLTERVKALEGERQPRRSADVDGDGSPAPKKPGPIDGLALRSALGIVSSTKQGGF